MRVKVKLFAALRESLGESEISQELEEPAIVKDLVTHLCAQDDKWQSLKGEHILVAVNQTMATMASELAPDAEVAFFPPVTGG